LHCPYIHAERIAEHHIEGNVTRHVGTATISIVLATSLLFIGVLTRGPAYPQQSIFTPNSSSTNPYVTTFPISQNSSDFTPFVLYPASNKTVWVVTIKQGNIVGNVVEPSQAQIVNFTIGAGGKPIATAVITLRNAIPSDIVYDRNLTRVWFLENNSLAYYNATAPRSITIEHTFPGGSPQFMTIDNKERIWITLLGTNQIVEYDPIKRTIVNFYNAPAASASLQGITVAPDGSVWFAETTVKRLGHIIPCQTTSCNVTDNGPPPGIVLAFPIQLAVDRGGTVWFTDHGVGQFGSFNPSTGEWRVFGIGYCSETYNPDCPIGLPNAISLDSNGMIWFSEHFAGRVAKYDPATGSLTEYFVPAITIPYVWWMWPGPGSLVWFTAFGLGEIGYVNASLPVPISISAGLQSVKVEQGAYQAIHASITDQAGGPVYLNVSANSHDAPFGSPPLLYGFADPSRIERAPSTVTATFRVSAALTADLGQRYVTLTAYDSNVAVNVFVNVNVTQTTIPFIFRTNAPYVSVGFASSIGAGSVALYLMSLPKNSQKDHDKRKVATKTDPEMKAGI
jgi:streptogramin lyase